LADLRSGSEREGTREAVDIEAATRDAEIAAATARAATENLRADADRLRLEIERSEAERRRRSRVLQAIVGFTAPPIVGLGILVLIFAGAASDAVIESPAATSIALIVGAVLMLVPPILFAVSHERYAQHQAAIENRLLALLSAGESSTSRSVIGPAPRVGDELPSARTANPSE
jgi:hypothetical protein